MTLLQLILLAAMQQIPVVCPLPIDLYNQPIHITAKVMKRKTNDKN